MEISEAMVAQYLGDITISYFNDEELPPDELSGYDKCIRVMRRNAENHGDLEYLKLALEHILGNPEVSCERLSNERYPFDEEEVREIIQYARDSIWPEAGPIPPGGPPGVRLVPTSLEAWWASRPSLRKQD